MTRASRPSSASGSSRLLRRRRKIGDMTNKEVRALLDETARALLVLRAGRLGGCVGDDGSCRFARIGECVLAVAAAGGEDGQVVEGVGHIGVVCAERLLLDRQRALVERLGVGVLALVCVHDGQVVEGVGHIGVVCAERLLLDRQRALVEPLGVGVLALLLVHDRPGC